MSGVWSDDFVAGRASFHTNQDKRLAKAGFLAIVMPGPDPGTPATAGVRGGPRVKPGADDLGNGRADKMGNGWADQTICPSPLYPDTFGAKLGSGSAGKPAQAASKRNPTALEGAKWTH